MLPDKLLSQCLAECLGTLLLVFLGFAAVASIKLAGASYGQWEIAILWVTAVVLAVYLIAGVSGAHLNHAVTFTLCLCLVFAGQRVIPYIIAQLLGAFLAAVMVYLLYFNLFAEAEESAGIVRGSVASLEYASIFSTYPHPALNFGGAFMVEVVIAAILLL